MTSSSLEEHSARHYAPSAIFIAEADGTWLTDIYGAKYLYALSGVQFAPDESAKKLFLSPIEKSVLAKDPQLSTVRITPRLTTRENGVDLPVMALDSAVKEYVGV
jgi:acetylornithine/succinyldiaminopimelate/putrescine aminotransferase